MKTFRLQFNGVKFESSRLERVKLVRQLALGYEDWATPAILGFGLREAVQFVDAVAGGHSRLLPTRLSGEDAERALRTLWGLGFDVEAVEARVRTFVFRRRDGSTVETNASTPLAAVRSINRLNRKLSMSAVGRAGGKQPDSVKVSMLVETK